MPTKNRITEVSEIPDDDIDLSDIPEVTEEQFRRAKPSGWVENKLDG